MVTIDAVHRLLLIDDDDFVRETLALRIAAAGHHVQAVESGAKALELLGQKEFDLVVLDRNMPGASGLDVLRDIRRRYSLLELPVLMLTGLESDRDILEAFAHGANDYFFKGADPRIFLERLRITLLESQFRRSLARQLRATEAKLQSLSKKLEAQMVNATLQRILYVEDDPDIRLLGSLTLTGVGGFEVEACRSGEEALARAESFLPDLLLLDVVLPDMDGPTTLARLRELPNTRHTPAIFMTAQAQTHEILKYQQLGAIDVVNKPFDPMLLPKQLQVAWMRYHGQDLSKNAG